MRVVACVAAVLASVATSAAARNFVNLDFDQARLPDPAEGFLFLPWDKGAPGWGHSDGESTDHLTYPDVHTGYSQTYALIAAPFGPASGMFGLGMRSGTFHEDEPRGDFVQAFLSQTGKVGAGATSVSLLTSSFLFELSLNGNRIDMQPVGLDPASPTYAEDLTNYILRGSSPWIPRPVSPGVVHFCAAPAAEALARPRTRVVACEGFDGGTAVDVHP